MSAALSANVPANVGSELYAIARELFPLNRSITGQGVRDTLAAVSRVLPLQISALATGTEVFDWTIPKEWNLKEAFIEDAQGRRIVDSRNSNLHVVGYSVPVDEYLSLVELRPHLHALPEHPDWIPYRTSYYRETWGFCVTDRLLATLTEQRYRVRIDATLAPGVLNFAEAVIPGDTEDEFLISAHVCHPSLCNDNLSGIAIAAVLGRELARERRRYTYRIVFAPGTIGAIAWLATREDAWRRVRHGLVAALLGRPGPMTYKKTKSGAATIDRAVARVFSERQAGDQIIAFSPWGYDERQFNSPGIDLDVGRLTRAPESGYPEYHTSADNLELVTPAALDDSFRAFCSVIDVIERNATYRNLRPRGEPQLGKYGLYAHLGGATTAEAGKLALLWVLNQSDGSVDLLEVAERSGLPFADIALAASLLENASLLERAAPSAGG
jgi:aminopeptidase-like protein